MSTSYAFCETATAGPNSKWHIRRLTHRGKKLGGGADTLALCSAKPAWDLNAEITYHALQQCCLRCKNEYIDETTK
jgi:hypothetical protein